MLSTKTVLSAVFAFFVLTFLVYGASLNNNFVRWDDGLLIYENPIVREISPWSVGRAFSTYDPELYIPLTLLSYQIDYLIGGTNPFVYHFGNLVLHTVNALLAVWFVFLLLRRNPATETGGYRRRDVLVPLFSGLLFAVHPLHTEAVAWASARKDVLAAFFFLASTVAYIWYGGALRRVAAHGPLYPAGLPYALSLAFFLLGLLSKVIVITLPLVLLLIDYQQGRRISIKDKLPYFAFSMLFGIIALFGKTAVTAEATPIETVLVAGKSTVFYLEKLFFPAGLSVLYPYTQPVTVTSPVFFGPLILVTILAALAVYGRRCCRDIPFAALFFLITLLPTFVNFSKGGDIYFASDRYAYIPSIGIIYLLVLALFTHVRAWKTVVAGLSVILLLFATMSNAQARVWKDSEALFRNVLEHYPDSHRARNNLGNVYRRQGLLDEAIVEFQSAISVRETPKALGNLGAVYRKKGMIPEALRTYERAIALDPADPEPHFGLGIVYARRGDTDRALRSYERALELDPRYAEVYTNVGALLMAGGQITAAIEQYRKAIAADRFFVQASYNLGIALTKIGRIDEAIEAYEQAIDLRPDFIAARINLGILYYEMGRIDESAGQFRAVLEIDPGNAAARSALSQLGAAD